MGALESNVKNIIECLGGNDNISAVSNCMTRLRIVVIDEAAVDTAKLNKLEDVLGVVHDRALAYEIVVGPGKCKKYAQCCADMGIISNNTSVKNVDGDWKKNKAEMREQQKQSRLKGFLKVLGDIFIPLIPGIIVAGISAGFSSLIAQVVPEYESNKVWYFIYQILSLINSSFMTYITAWAGYRAAEKFGATPILGGMLGMITSLGGVDKIASIMGLYNDAVPLDSILRVGKGGVLAVIIGVYILSKVEKKLRLVMPDTLDIIFTPLLTMLICVIPYIVVVMPLFGYISSGIAWVFSQVCMSESVIVRVIFGYLAAALFLPLVAMGMHHGMVALYSVQLQELGFVTLYPTLAMAGAGQVGAAIAIWQKAKKVNNKKLRSVIAGALPAGFLGIGEPLIYGVTLPLGRPFLTAGLGAGFGGAFVTMMRVAATTWGPSGLIAGFTMTAGPGGAINSVAMYMIGLVISYVCAYLITRVTFDEKLLLTDEDEQFNENVHISADATANEVKHGENLVISAIEEGCEDYIIGAPADGIIVKMQEIPDTTFSEGILGPCVGVRPSNGDIYAPCDGTVVGIVDTKHAISIEGTDESGILIHVGIDTVKLKGEGFKVMVSEGDSITKGQKLIEADVDLIEKSGYSSIVIVAKCE